VRWPGAGWCGGAGYLRLAVPLALMTWWNTTGGMFREHLLRDRPKGVVVLNGAILPFAVPTRAVA
jgi:hypothetical protein